MEVRNELLDYGILPISLFLPKFETATNVVELHSKLLLESEEIDGRKGMVVVKNAQKRLKINQDIWDIVLDALETVGDTSVQHIWLEGLKKTKFVDCHALSLFLFFQVYGRITQKTESEIRSHSPTDNKKDHIALQRSLSSTRMPSILTFPSFLRRHIQLLVYMILDRPPVLASAAWNSYISSGGKYTAPTTEEEAFNPEYRLWITASEVDRLGLLLRHKDSNIRVNGEIGKTASSVPGIGEWKRLSSWMSFFNGKEENHPVPCEDVIAWLVANILDTDIEKSMPDSKDEFNGKVIDKTKGTVVRGEDKFPNKELYISGCQDSCVYALAPLLRAKVTSCTDCTVVIGPVAGCLIIENCTGLKLVCACKRIFITSSHDSVIYLGTNRPPVLFGDNRFLKLAPYNTSYDKLQIHMDIAGLSGSPNLWDKPIQIGPKEPININKEEINEETIKINLEDKEDEKEKSLLLPCDELLPFIIPFKGSTGMLAGGPSTESQVFWNHRSSNSGVRDSSLFELPKKYEDAMNMKLVKVSELQDTAGSFLANFENKREVQVVIQSYFKDWLFRTGRIRQVYDLARLEQQKETETTNLNASSVSNTTTTTTTASKERKSMNSNLA